MYFAGGDIDNAFYRCEVPSGARKFLTLPAVKARWVGVDRVDGKRVEGEEWIVPELTVSPMGWSWSLWICQSLHEQLAREAGTDSNYCILDRKPCPPLEPSKTKHALYVDMFLFLGRNAESVGSDCDRHSNHLRNNGHEIHEDFGPCTEATFSSLDFNWQRNVARVGSRRSWRLRLELD